MKTKSKVKLSSECKLTGVCLELKLLVICKKVKQVQVRWPKYEDYAEYTIKGNKITASDSSGFVIAKVDNFAEGNAVAESGTVVLNFTDSTNASFYWQTAPTAQWQALEASDSDTLTSNFGYGKRKKPTSSPRS